MRRERGGSLAGSDRGTGKWFKSAVALHGGSIAEIRRYIPGFERRCFALTQPDSRSSRLNERQDVIVRRPIDGDSAFIPVGVVSKEYSLIQHQEVCDILVAALKVANINANDVEAELRITEYGERMALSLFLPREFAFDPGDGHAMALRLECVNSVDGTTGFRALMGWFRFVCSNGLVIGVTRSDLRRRHIGALKLDDVSHVLMSGLKECDAERRNFALWRRTLIGGERLTKWIDNDLKNAWGFKAAARAFHIAISGCDVTVIGPFKGHSPTTVRVAPAEPVPGAPRRCGDLFDLSQILAWLARARGDVEEQLAWREQIPDILKPFIPEGQLEMELTQANGQ